MLYIVQTGLLDLPILYLSRYINQYKADYYKLLQAVRDDNDWESWLVFMLSAVESTAIYTITQFEEIKELMVSYKKIIRENTDIYSHELLNGLFKHPYTTINFMEQELEKDRRTVSKYLNKLVEIGLLKKLVIKNSHYFINTKLYDIFNKEHRLTNLHKKQNLCAKKWILCTYKKTYVQKIVFFQLWKKHKRKKLDFMHV